MAAQGGGPPIAAVGEHKAAELDVELDRSSKRIKTMCVLILVFFIFGVFIQVRFKYGFPLFVSAAISVVILLAEGLKYRRLWLERKAVGSMVVPVHQQVPPQAFVVEMYPPGLEPLPPPPYDKA